MDELAKLLGTTKGKLERLSEEMGEFTGKKDLPQQFLEHIRSERSAVLSQVGLSENSSYTEVLEVLRDQAKKVEEELLEIFAQPDLQDHSTIQTLFARAYEIVAPPKGLFLKREKAKEFFQKNPPKNILSQLGYDSVDKLLEKEDLFEVYSALRFLEERKWQNEVFFSPFSELQPDDFESREIVVRILDPKKWGSSALNFVKKKFHNTTHLKELGVVIIIPIEYTPGALTRMFSMMFHYLNEVSFYARYFARIAGKDSSAEGGASSARIAGKDSSAEGGASFETLAGDKESFASKFVSALRGDVRDSAPVVENIVSWIIMQRYLAKEDPGDPRLLNPRVSPEALHWSKAVADLAKLGESAPGLSFWAGKAHLAGFFATKGGSASGGDGKFTSFNFEDNVFSLAAGLDAPQYTYHAREALWNRFFSEYFDGGEKALETLMVEDFGQGLIGFKIRS
ncbi:MAG: hypothetical protein BMS9Abin34_103 [Patescibacteria group bacterium]|nr:MAG: hypothetical protein BMS9Abin34_103 [Patescibacteria group bacterium]